MEELRERFGDKIMEVLRRRVEVKLIEGKSNVVECLVKFDVFVLLSMFVYII